MLIVCGSAEMTRLRNFVGTLKPLSELLKAIIWTHFYPSTLLDLVTVAKPLRSVLIKTPNGFLSLRQMSWNPWVKDWTLVHWLLIGRIRHEKENTNIGGDLKLLLWGEADFISSVKAGFESRPSKIFLPQRNTVNYLFSALLKPGRKWDYSYKPV